MTSRERIFAALSHREPDRVPFDLGGTVVTGICLGAYRELVRALGLAEQPECLHRTQQLARPSEALLERLRVDTRGLLPGPDPSWRPREWQDESYLYFEDQWGTHHRMPKRGGLYYDVCRAPLGEPEVLSPSDVAAYPMPDAANPLTVRGLREQAERFRAQGKCVILKSPCAGALEMATRLRGMDKFLMDLALAPRAAAMLMDRIIELKIEYWRMAMAELGHCVDVLMEADDYGTQNGLLLAPAMWRKMVKPRLARLVAEVKKASGGKPLFFHSCGAVREVIPDLIELGIDILNPVQLSAAGMDTAELKRLFGDDLVFWGGGADTQTVLAQATPAQVREHVKRQIDILAPAGGFVFAAVHNIQNDVPPENILAMWETLMEHGRY